MLVDFKTYDSHFNNQTSVIYINKLSKKITPLFLN
jgi:hypothetical protein